MSLANRDSHRQTTPQPVHYLAAALMFCIAAGAAAPLAAQTLEEIVVTAQKREQSLQDVSIAVTAWGGDEIRKFNLQQSHEIARFTPGVNVAATSGGQDAQFTIRGVVQTDFNDSIEPPNAVYVDEGYMATVQGNRFGLFDLDRVEILRGPQGTLFGRNATGGLVHYVTNKPGEELGGYADLLVGKENQTRLEAAINVPFTDKLSGRLSGVFNRHDELIENIYPAGNVVNPLTGVPFVPSASGQSDYWNDDSLGLRGQLAWQASDDVRLLISAFAWNEDLATGGSYEQEATTAIIDAQGRHVNSIFAADDPQGCEAISAETGACIPIDFVDGTFGNTVRPVQGGDLFGFTDPGLGGDQRSSLDHSLDDFNQGDQFGVTVKLEWDLGFASLTSVSHFMDYEKQQSLDTDLSPIPQSVVINSNDSDTFSEEIRLSSETDNSRWVAGFFFLNYDNANKIGFGFPPDSPITLLLPFGPFESISFADWDRESYSLFGQLDYDLSDSLTLVAGLRLIQEESEYDYRQFLFPSSVDHLIEDNQPPLMTGFEYPPFVGSKDDTLWAGKLMLEYRPSDELLVYGGVNRGTKAGGFNGKLNDFTPPLDPTDIPYDEEVLWAYEAGFKSTVLDGTTRINGSAYYYDYQDYQAFVFVGSSGFVRNADAETFGLELEVTSRPTEALDLSLSVSYINATVESLEVATDLFRDVEPPHNPEWQAAAVGRYTWPNAFAGGRVALQGAVTFTDSRFHNIRNFDATEMDDYTLVDARLSWTSADERWDVAVFADNIFDEDYRIAGFDLATFCGCNEEAWGRPAWWGVQLRYSAL